MTKFIEKIIPVAFIAGFLSITLLHSTVMAGDCFQDPVYERDWNAEVTTGAFLRDVACMEGSEIVTTLPVGEVIHVIAETDGWYQIERADGQTGWVGQWLITATDKPFNSTVTETEQKEPLYDIVGHKNEYSIRELYGMGIVSGHPDGSFKPDDPLNRAEMVKLLVEATVDDFDTRKTAYQYQCFTDIAADEWYTPYVCYAKENTIVEGYPDGLFRPANNIIKVEAVKVVLEAFDWEIPPPPSEFSFNDTSGSEWYAPYLDEAYNNNILEPVINMYFYPNEDITRGGVSHIIYQTLMSEKTTF